MVFFSTHVDGLRRPVMQPLPKMLCALTAVLALWAVDTFMRTPPEPIAQALVPIAMAHGADADATSLQRVAQGAVPMPEGAAAAHASNLVVMHPDHAAALTLFWFSGERESGPLVQIAASQWVRSKGAWSAPRYVVNRHAAGELLGHGLRRLGNPVAWMDPQGQMHLFVVATGWGGWAASRILHLQQSSVSQDLAELEFEPVGVLPLSWLWNTSYLVRNAPLPLQDGGMALPVHFELGSKVPAVLRFDDHGGFKGMVRLSQRNYLLQPTLLPITSEHWLALMRDERPDGKIGVAQTHDGGVHWQDLPDLPLDNPDAAVAGLALSPGQLLLAHNTSTSGRARLELSYSEDGLHWMRLETVRQGEPQDEFSYPAMAWADGSLWLSYTVDRTSLAWQRFAPRPPVHPVGPSQGKP